MTTTSKILSGVLVVIVLAATSLAVAISHTSACGPAPTLAPAQPMRAAVHRCYGSPDVAGLKRLPNPSPQTMSC